MWWLVLILVSPVAGFSSTQPLASFPSQADCERARQHVTIEMEIAYPDDASYMIRCLPPRQEL